MEKDVKFIILLIVGIVIVCSLLGFALIKIIGLLNMGNLSMGNQSKIAPKVINCIDKDERNYTYPGKTCIGNKCNGDKCTSNRNLVEYYCSGNKILSESVKCSPGTFCTTKFNGTSYCVNSVQSITLKADRTKVNYLSDNKKKILFYSTLKQEPFNPLSISVYLGMNSVSAGKYKSYDEKQMVLNKTTGRYEIRVAVKDIETYGEPITNLTAAALAKADNVVVQRSKPIYILINR